MLCDSSNILILKNGRFMVMSMNDFVITRKIYDACTLRLIDASQWLQGI